VVCYLQITKEGPKLCEETTQLNTDDETLLLSYTNFWTEWLVLVEKMFWSLLHSKGKEKTKVNDRYVM